MYVHGDDYNDVTLYNVIGMLASTYMYNMVIYYGKETQLITKSELNHTTNDGSTCRSGL